MAGEIPTTVSRRSVKWLHAHYISGRAVAVVNARDHLHPGRRITMARVGELIELARVKRADKISRTHMHAPVVLARH